MGMYTELYISCRIKEGSPTEVIDILRHMFDKTEEEELMEGAQRMVGEKIEHPPLPDHEFFRAIGWTRIGRTWGCGAVSKIDIEYGEECYITSKSELQNRDREIEKFIDWIMPYIDGLLGDHIGHYRYENDQTPTLIFKEKGHA